MATMTCDHLEGLVLEIAHENPNGLRHADFVTKVLRSGFVHKGQAPLSAVVHQTISKLVTEGVFVRCEDEDRGTRQYQLAGAGVAVA